MHFCFFSFGLADENAIGSTPMGGKEFEPVVEAMCGAVQLIVERMDNRRCGLFLEKERPEVEVRVDDVEVGGALKTGGEILEVPQRILPGDSGLGEGFVVHRHKFCLRFGARGGKERDLVSSRNLSVCKFRDDAFDAAVLFRRNREPKRCDMSDSEFFHAVISL